MTFGWGELQDIQHQWPDSLHWIHAIYVNTQDEENIKSLDSSAGTTSKLPKEVQELVKMIFDVGSMKKAMLEYEVFILFGVIITTVYWLPE